METYKKIFVSVIFIGILGLSIISGITYSKWVQTSAAPCNKDTKTYTNQQFHFLLEYPAALSVIQVDGDSVSFSTPEGPWDFYISVKETTLISAKDWLASQPKGGVSNPGIEAVLWFSYDDMYPTVFVAEYKVIDYDGDTPIYGKSLSAVHIQSGKIYKLAFNTQIPANEVPRISPTTMDVVSSFQVVIN